MGLFDKVFKNQRDLSKQEIQEVPWHALTELKQIEQIRKESDSQAVVVFKHSTRCGISRMVLNTFERNYDTLEGEEVKLYLLDLLANREVSNALAEKTGIRHESPQILLFRNQRVVQHASHHSIDIERLKEWVQSEP